MQLTNVAELCYIIFGTVGFTVFSTSFVKTATGASLYPNIKIGSKTVNMEKVVGILRILFTSIQIVCWSFLTFRGVTGSLEDWIFYRRLFYFAVGGTAWFVSLPLITFFGGKVIRALESREPSDDLVESADPKKTKHVLSKSSVVKSRPESSVGNIANDKIPAIKNVPLTPLKLSRNQRLNILKLGVYGMMANYVTIVFIFCIWLFVNESFQHDYNILLYFKIATDFCFWVYGCWFNVVLYRKLYNSWKEKSPS